MILDLDAYPRANPFQSDCDVCIVGTGAAGLALAVELLPATNLRVTVLESGGFKPEPASQNLYESEVSGLNFVGHLLGRYRLFGGATTQWGGQALRLSPMDFQARDWIPHSGWPIAYDDLLDCYRRAGEFLRIDPLNYDTDLFPLLGTRPPEFDPAKVYFHFSKWAPEPDLRRLYRKPIEAASNVTLVLHANLTTIALAEGLGHVSELHVRSLNGASGVVRARYVVLALGGIEVARVLLANNTQQKTGIANAHDLVGRFFQDHPSAWVGQVRSDRTDHVQRLFNLFYRGRGKYSPRVSATDRFLREQRILNVSAALNFDAGEDSAYVAAKQVYALLRTRQIGRPLLRRTVSVLARAPSLVRPAYEYAVRRRGYAPRAIVRVRITSEQEPSPDSRILLADQRDALGIPRSRIQWQLSDLWPRTVRLFARTLRDEFARTGVGDLRLDAWVLDESADWRPQAEDSLHHIGTTRMADSPERGVVDGDCRVHGIDNLYIAGSSVFPTSGHSNPTLTLIALSIRLADLLKRKLA